MSLTSYLAAPPRDLELQTILLRLGQVNQGIFVLILIFIEIPVPKFLTQNRNILWATFEIPFRRLISGSCLPLREFSLPMNILR